MDTEVDYFSIPALDATGGPEPTASKEIDSHKLLLRGGEVLTSRLNPRKSRVHLVPTNLPRQSVASTEFVALRPMLIEPRYLAYLLQGEQTRQELDGLTRSATRSHQRVEPIEVLNLEVPIDQSDEQRRIADFLDDRVARIDQIIAARQRQLSLLASLRRLSLVDAVFRSEDTLTRCSAMVEVRLGRQRSPQNAEGDHMTPYLRSANVGDGRLFLDDVYSMNFEPSEQHIFSLERGDVLVTEGSASLGAVGAACRWNEDLPGTICFQNTLLRLRARSGVEQDFVEVWARASHANGAPRAFANGANILHLGADGMGRMPIPNISSEEQRNRVSCAREVLDACENQATRVNSEVGLLQEYKQSLITAAVTGEFDVTTASTKIPE